ncbi:polyribonucleotide nucleotidyltransferase [Anaplasmataceae bacterium AB001_6]|nr:polyribonucleotide nucleotidyltransferase [Anaplasmataceae bacterium AB001_6]
MSVLDSTFKFYGKDLFLEKGVYAGHSDRSVMVRYGGTVVFVSLSIGEFNPSGDKKSYFGLPLMVDFLFRAYAYNEIPKSFYRREGKLSEREILASRIIDRTFRPLIDDSVINDISLNCMLLSLDESCSPESAAIIGVSYVLGVSPLPFRGPAVGMGLNYNQGKTLFDGSATDFLPFTDRDGEEDVKLDLFVSSIKDAIIMIEAESKGIKEDDMLKSIDFIHKESQNVIAWLKANIDGDIDTLYSNRIDKSIVQLKNLELVKAIQSDYYDDFKKVFSADDFYKPKFLNDKRNLINGINEKFSENNNHELYNAVKSVEKEAMVDVLFDSAKRIDGRACDDIRNIDIKLDVLPDSHGSALFTRGGTQALVVTTLGKISDAQITDDYSGRKESFMLHYNFHPFSVGEIGGNRPPGRREVGHGCLALKSLKNVMPNFEDLPYTIRLVSEILSSDGSSSMATVCGSTLALMDSGVKISKPVAGIAMGLVFSKNSDDFVILSDISGEEDALGDMDFKVAGTDKYISALQMDVKTDKLTIEVLKVALEQAKKGRLSILEDMIEAIDSPRTKYKDTVRKTEVFKIHKAQISKIIGSGGKTIKSICEATESTIDIDDDKVYISSKIEQGLNDAVNIVRGIAGVNRIVPFVGMKTKALITGVQSFGAFAIIGSDNQGLIHVSEMTKEDGSRKGKSDNISLNEGDVVEVVVKAIDSATGKIQLSMFVDDYKDKKQGSSESVASQGKSYDFYKRKSASSNDENIKTSTPHARKSTAKRFSKENKHGEKGSKRDNISSGRAQDNRFVSGTESGRRKMEDKDVDTEDEGSIRFF